MHHAGTQCKLQYMLENVYAYALSALANRINHYTSEIPYPTFNVYLCVVY